MPRATSIISPIASSLTAGTQLRLACVTSTPCGARGLHVDVADVDGNAADGDEIGQCGEQRRLAGRRPVGDDDLTALRSRVTSAGVASGSGPSCRTTSPSACRPARARAP